MKPVEIRYSKITKKFPREFILLQGLGCFWKKCAFCDFYEDVSKNPFEINSKVIENITGKFGIVDVANSGSIMELDSQTLNMLIDKVKEKKIKEVWCEVHWQYRNQLDNFSEKFENVKLDYKVGIETFNPKLRSSWNKGIDESVSPDDIAKYFKSVGLLVGAENQTFEDAVSDIKIAKNCFKRCMVNVFSPNSKKIKENRPLINRFIQEIYPKIKDDPQIEILLNIIDLGVG